MIARRFFLILVPMLVFVPFVLTHQKPETKAARRIRDAYLAAEAPVFRAGGLPEVEGFGVKLKQIDTTSASPEVQDAMTRLTVAVEANAVVRRAGGDTNAANEKVVAAKLQLMRALTAWNGKPF
jgi:hypothetical protein